MKVAEACCQLSGPRIVRRVPGGALGAWPVYLPDLDAGLALAQRHSQRVERSGLEDFVGPAQSGD